MCRSDTYVPCHIRLTCLHVPLVCHCLPIGYVCVTIGGQTSKFGKEKEKVRCRCTILLSKVEGDEGD
jgi:hypothetical protein